jgi:hypothetical protein
MPDRDRRHPEEAAPGGRKEHRLTLSTRALRSLAPWAAGAAILLGLHALALGRVPPGLAADPAVEALRGLRLVVERRFEVLTVSIGPSAETLFLYLTGASLAAFGPVRWALAVPSILASVATALLTARFARTVRPALPLSVALLLPASSVWLFHYGQVGLRAIAAPLFLLATAFFLEDENGSRLAARPRAAGAAMGLSLYAYSACRLLPIAWAAHLAWRAFRWPSLRPGLAAEARRVGLAFLLVSVPNVLLLVRAPDAVLNRGYDSNRGTLSDKAANAAATFLLPFGYPDRYRVWKGEGHVFDMTGVALTASGLDPLDPVAAALAVLGLLALTRRRASNGLSFLVAAWLAGGALLGAFGPSLTRLLILAPAWIVFAAIGADALLAAAPRLRLPAAAFLGAWLLLRAEAYATTFGASAAAAEAFHEKVTAMGERARDLAAGGSRVLLVARNGRDVVKYFCWSRIESVYLVTQEEGSPALAGAPLEGFAPDVVLVERDPGFDGWGERAGLVRIARTAEFTEYRRPGPARAPTVRSNLWRLWSPMSL